MSRAQKQIKVIMHIPEDEESLNALQEITDDFFAHMIEKNLRNTNLTLKEKLYIAHKVAENLG